MINWIISLFQRFGGGRSSKWRKIRAEYIKINPVCEVCGKKRTLFNSLEVHHVIPVSIDKTKELDDNNLITFCREHHFLFGHLRYWKSYNKEAKQDTIIWRNKIKYRT